MLKKVTKNIMSKGFNYAVKLLPVVIPALLVFNANSTACIVNGQPEPPANLKNYRKF